MSQPLFLRRQDLILIVEILGLGIWSLRDYKNRSKESERHTLSWELKRAIWLRKSANLQLEERFCRAAKADGLKKPWGKSWAENAKLTKQGRKSRAKKTGPYMLSSLGCKKFLN
jgi:hypothetical protein